MENMPREIEIKTTHFRYAAKRWGSEQGIPTLALHGWLDNAATFDFIAPLLPNLNLVALDFPGHGYSGHRPLGIKYHYLDYIADVISVVDALKWERFNLIGHSLGAGVASMTAGTFVDRVEKLVLLEGIAPMTRDPIQSPDYLARSVSQMRTLATKKTPLYKGKEEIIQARAKVGDMTRQSVEVLVERGIVILDEGVTWRSDPRLRVGSPSYLMEEQIEAFLDRVEADTLLIIAESGLFSDKQHLQKRSGRIKNLQQVDVVGGHHVHLDDPAVVAPHLLSFL